MKSARIVAITAAALLSTVAHTASASLVYNSALLAPAQGFGTAPRILSFSNNDTESGCVGVSGTGSIVVGSAGCLAAAVAVHDSNGVTNTGGNEDSPPTDNQKFGIPTLGSLGITSASQIGILFNATEPGGDAVSITDVTLKFYSSGGALLGAIDGAQNFANSNPGNGVAGFTFVVSADEQGYVDGLIASNVILALESTITGAAGGSESYLIYNLRNTGTVGGNSSVPEPLSIAVLGTALTGLGLIKRRRRG